jgi:hypothetical protein
MLCVQTNTVCGARLVSNTAYRRGQVICQVVDYRLTRQPTYQTVQVGRDRHLEDFGVLAYLNHSCQPNTHLDTTTLTLLAIQDIAAGDELTFFYPSTEWQMARPFACRCGARGCLGYIAGAKHLSIDVLSRYALNRHIQALIVESLIREESADLQVSEMETECARAAAEREVLLSV